MSADRSAHVFSEPTGRRWQRVRAGAYLLGALSTVGVFGLIVAALLPPALPQFDAFTPATRRHAPAVVGSRAARLRESARERLYRALRHQGQPPAVRPGRLPLHPVRERRGSPDSIFAGFYVNWDDNSFASLKAHVDQLDWVIAEWGFVTPGGDSLQLKIDPKLLFLIQSLPDSARPRVLLMLSNVTQGVGEFGGSSGPRLLADATRRQRAVRQAVSAVRRLGLAGITVDFESMPEGSLPDIERFLDELRKALGQGPLLTMAIEPSLDLSWVRRFTARCDRVLLMLYDEHYGSGPGAEAGPVASRAWYAERTRHLLEAVPAAKAIAAFSAYGYDWNDAGSGSGDAVTSQDVWRFSRENNVLPQFDTLSRNPYLAWTAPDSTDHVIWYQDAVTALDQMRSARALGITSHAVWRLGEEDQSLWRAINRRGELQSPDSLRLIEPGSDVEFRGGGELLAIGSHPRTGSRTVAVDATGAIARETMERVPSPWVVNRTGRHPGRVALTFDDGPDRRWTPMILDTLRSRGVHGAFFMIGTHIEASPALARRVLAEGHEIGNHTFTHPNLALTSDWVTRLEIDANERLIEAVLDRRTILFRPPYFGDAEPTTADELVPVSIATDLGYINVGTRVDAEDWTNPGAERIVENVMDALPRGEVVLLHDGGGDRSQTVAALGPLIDSLRAAGDTFVSLGDLAGLPPSVTMPPIPPRGAWLRAMELMAFGSISLVERGVYTIFFIAIVLGMGRLGFILVLAAIQRFRRSRASMDYHPSVSVIVPAYNEAKVIPQTVRSLLAQEYLGAFEIVVVDDGSPDGTGAIVEQGFADDARVTVYRKENGGKASALNFGIARAQGEIVVGLDADTLFEPGTVAHLVAPLVDPKVGAVAGNAKVGNRINLVTRWQALEYITSQNLDRRAFALLDCITVVPGAVGAWRKSLVLEAGGFSSDTLAEDQDLTLAIGRRGHRVAYAGDAVAWTEAPDTLRTLAKQRFRWAFGTLQCAWKHRDLLFRPSAGTLGFVALPNVWIFQLLFAVIAPLADLLFVWSLLSIALTQRSHGSTYALASLEQVVSWYALFLLVDWLASVLAFLMEPGEDRRLTWLVFLQRFAYRQVMYWVVVRSVVAALRGGLVGWGKLDRKATVAARATAP
ncbi:MAG: glycosyltransferase [Gemmatimonadota bacterium]